MDGTISIDSVSSLARLNFRISFENVAQHGALLDIFIPDFLLHNNLRKPPASFCEP